MKPQKPNPHHHKPANKNSQGVVHYPQTHSNHSGNYVHSNPNHIPVPIVPNQNIPKIQITYSNQKDQLKNSGNLELESGGLMGGHFLEKNIHLPLTLLNSKKEDKDKKVVAVIVSFVAGSSYDDLFTTVEQKSMEGTKVLVYSVGADYI